jgi:hypothetical protein
MQTSIEWFIEQVFGEHTKVWHDVIEKAKEMHKQEIIEARIVADNELQRKAAEQYYSETFKNSKP